jgi:type IV secretory pathway TraG/TraD family ATPase VirD4
LSNPFIRPILGQSRSTISFQDIMDNGKWLIVNISRDKLKESRRLLGALIVALIHNAAIGRDRRRLDERVFHSLFVDEFEEFWTPTFLHI